MTFIVTVDGPSCSGKGTISTHLCEVFSLKHLDSGLLYRAGGAWALSQGMEVVSLREDEIESVCAYISSLHEKDIDEAALRNEYMASAASSVALVQKVRDAVNGWVMQQIEALPSTYRGAVVDGRDGGTVVFPHAHLKLFITAHEGIRKARRHAQQSPTPQSTVAQNPEEKLREVAEAESERLLQERDKRDHGRSPVLPAPDAYIIDTSHLSLDEALRIASEYMLSTIG